MAQFIFGSKLSATYKQKPKSICHFPNFFNFLGHVYNYVHMSGQNGRLQWHVCIKSTVHFQHMCSRFVHVSGNNICVVLNVCRIHTRLWSWEGIQEHYSCWLTRVPCSYIFTQKYKNWKLSYDFSVSNWGSFCNILESETQLVKAKIRLTFFKTFRNFGTLLWTWDTRPGKILVSFDTCVLFMFMYYHGTRVQEQ